MASSLTAKNLEAQMKQRINRRDFLRTNLGAALAASAFPAIIPASALGRDRRAAPSERITVGIIGAGPQARWDASQFLAQPDAQVIAVNDVNRAQLEASRKLVNDHYGHTDCATYGDYRELLARDDLDAVLIASPDHWHVAHAVAAARAGKDLYLEKPMGLSVAEDQLLRKVVRREKRVFQFGTQQRSSARFRQACELVRNGRIGTLRQINVWCPASRPGGSTTPAPVPPELDYDQWLGPAPDTPYTEGKCFETPKAWKNWWFNSDYALGFIAGWGVHPLDIALWGHPSMMNGPIEVEGKAIFPTQGACDTAVAWEVHFTFATGVRLTYRGVRNGYDEPCELNDLRAWYAKYGGSPDHGTAFEGSEGWVMVDRGALRASSPSLLNSPLGPGDLRLPESANHARNFLDAVKTRRPSICPIGEAVQADLLCHLSDLATRLGRRLTWDPKKERFIKDAEANRRLKLRPRREPWRLSDALDGARAETGFG